MDTNSSHNADDSVDISDTGEDMEVDQAGGGGKHSLYGTYQYHTYHMAPNFSTFKPRITTPT